MCVSGLYAEILQRGGENLGYFKQRQGEHWKTTLKMSLVILRGVRLTQGGGGECPIPKF